MKYDILYFQDAHITGHNPVSRKGSYYEDLVSKFKKMLDLAEREKVKAIIDGGDLLDCSLVSNSIVDEILDIIEIYKIPVYSLMGNHPMVGHKLELSKSSSLAHMYNRCKYLKHLDELKIGKLNIKGYEYYHDIEKDIKEKGLIDERKESPKLAVVHAMITLKPFFENTSYAIAKEIKTNFDVILCGHYHQPWGIKEYGNTKFINIGCFGRTSISEKDVEPSVVLLDESLQNIKIVPIEHKKSEECFNLDKIEEKKLYNAEIEKFISELKNTKIQGMKLRDKVEFLAKQNNTKREVVDDIISRIGKYEQEKI